MLKTSIIYREYYSLAEAITAVRNNVGSNYFISVVLKGKQHIISTPEKTYSEVVITKEKEEEERKAKLET